MHQPDLTNWDAVSVYARTEQAIHQAPERLPALVR